MPFDPNTAVDISADEAVKFNPNTAQDIPTPEVNIYDNDTKKVISMPSTFDEDRMRYVKSTQAFHQSQSDFWGMSEVKNSMFNQIRRGITAFAYQLPSHLRSVYKAAVETQTTQLKKMPETMSDFDRVTYGLMTGQAMESVFIKGFKPSATRTVITNEKLVKKIDETNEANRKFIEKSGLAKTAADGFFYDLSSGIGSLGTAVALSAITRSPASAAILFGGIQKGSSYEELRAKGYSPEYANKVSNIAGMAEAGLEFIGLDLFMRGMKGNKIIGRFIKGAITEGMQEASQTTAEEFVMQKFGGREKEGMDTLKDIAYSGLLGMIIGAPTSTILGAGANIGKKKGISKKQSDAIINKVLTHDKIENQALKLFDNQNDPLTFPNADENLAVKGLDEILTEIETRKAEEAKGIKETVKSEILEAGVDEAEAEQVSDIMQARAEASASALGISQQEWLESKKLQYKGETPELSINEAIQEETLIEEIERPTEVLFQREEYQQQIKEIDEQISTLETQQKENEKKIEEINKQFHPIVEKTEKLSQQMWKDYIQAQKGLSKSAKKKFPSINEWQKTHKLYNEYKNLSEQETKLWDEKQKLYEPERKIEALGREKKSILGKIEEERISKIPVKVVDKSKLSINQREKILKKIKTRNKTVEKEKFTIEMDGLTEEVMKNLPDDIVITYHSGSEYGSYYIEYAKIATNEKGQLIDTQSEDKPVLTITKDSEGYNIYKDEKNDVEYNLDEYSSIIDINTHKKVSIRTHEPSPFREKEFGALDDWLNLGKEATLIDYNNALTQFEEVMHELSDFTPKRLPKDILQQQARGQIEFGDDSTVIRLFQGKDRTTLLHETGHLFLRDMQAVAEQSQDPQAMEDMQILRDFYKVKEDEAFSREQEEKFADDFVGFVMSGKAPNAKLVSSFERFKQWLLSMYEKVKTRVTLTPEVREVFDRMLGGYDVETATTADIQDLSTRLTELSTLADNLKAGKLADITQAQMDELESLINAAKQRPPAEPQSLFGWIRRRGGVWDKGGELRDMDLPAGIIRTKADSYLPNQALYNALDTTREAAIEEGFLDEGADINDLLEAISQEAKEKKVYRKIDAERLNERESILKNKDDAEMILSQLDINPEEILQIIRKNRAKQLKAVPTPEFAGVLSRIERLERAVGRIATEQERLTEAQIKAITKADIKEIQNRVIDLIKSARLEAKDRAKFIAAIKNIQTGEQLAKILPSLQERIFRYRETTQKANIREQIRKELKTIKPTVISGKLKGKFDAETQQALQTFKDIEKMTIEKAREAWQQVFEKARALQYKPTELELIQNQWLQVQAYYQASTQKDLQEVLNYIKTLKSDARIKLFERIEAEKEKRQAMIDRTKKAVDAATPFDPKAVQQQKGWKKSFNWIFDHLNVWAHDWNSLLNKILADKTLSDMFSVKIEDAEFKKQELWNKDNANMKSMLMEAYDLPENQISKAFSAQMDILEFENILGSDNVKRNHSFRRGQLIDMFAASKNEETLSILTDPEIHAFSEQGLNTLFNSLTEQDKKLANALIKYYDEKGYPELNKVVKKLNGINLPKAPNYYPRSREGKFAEDENIISQVIYQASTTPSAIKLRAKSKARLTFMNALSRLERYNEEKNIYISMAEVVSELNSIFRDQDLRAKVKGKFTPKTMQAIDAHLKTFGLETQKDIDSLWIQARGAFTGLKTGISTVIFLKQLTSLSAYTEVLSPKQFISGIIDFMKHPVKKAKWLRANSEFLKFRIAARAFDRDIKALERSKLARLTPITKWNDFMTAFVRAGDIMAIYPGMWAMIKAGKTMREAERFSNRTQQSASASKMSLAQKGTPYQRLFTMFKSAPLQYHRKLMIATRDMLRGNISKKQAIRIYAVYAVILPALFSAVGQGFRPDKDLKEFFNNILTGNVGAIFMLGDLIKMISASSFGMKFYPPSFPFWDEFEDLAKELPKAVKSDLDDVKWDDLITSILEVSTPFTGVMIPAKRGWNATEGLYEVFDGKNRTKGLLKMAGYTDYRAKKITEE